MPITSKLFASSVTLFVVTSQQCLGSFDILNPSHCCVNFFFVRHSFDGNLVEDWSRFPSAQHRLYQTILSSGIQSPILISGDVHMAEFSRRDCRQRLQPPNDNKSPEGAHHTYSNSRMLLEVTISGM
jgi:phosphodiesterase/alkaline phosphatase D-like protein